MARPAALAVCGAAAGRDLLRRRATGWIVAEAQHHQASFSTTTSSSTTTTTTTTTSSSPQLRRLFHPGNFDTLHETATAKAIGVLVDRLRLSPMNTAQQLAESLTPAERGAIVFALRSRNKAEGIGDLAEAFLEADANMDGKLSKEEFAAYWAVVRQEQVEKSRLAAAAAASRAKGAKIRPPAKPTTSQLSRTALASGIPFVGFGFVDNAIMLTAGNEIEASLGAALGLSTLAAAGLGNLISDVAGLGLADTIEVQARRRFGVKEPALRKDQVRLPSTRAARAAGASLGVTVGCLLGMVPLLFMTAAAPGEDEDDGEGAAVA